MIKKIWHWLNLQDWNFCALGIHGWREWNYIFARRPHDEVLRLEKEQLYICRFCGKREWHEYAYYKMKLPMTTATEPSIEVKNYIKSYK